MSAIFIVNMLSHRVATKGSRLEALADQYDIELYSLDDFKSLPAKVSEIAQSNIGTVFIEGGDGTVQGVLSTFLRQSAKFKILPKFAIIEGGMTNQVAKNIGLKASLLPSTLKSEFPSHPVSLLSIQTDSTNTHYGFLFSTGAVPMVTEYTKRNLHKRGIGGSLAVAGGILKGISASNGDVLKPTAIHLRCSHPQIDIKKDHIGTILTTLPSLIMGFDPFWGKEDGSLRLTYVDDSYRRLYRNVSSLWTGNKRKDRRPDGLQSWNVEQVDYKYHGPCVLDGEPLTSESGTFSIKASQALNFIQAR